MAQESNSGSNQMRKFFDAYKRQTVSVFAAKVVPHYQPISFLIIYYSNKNMSRFLKFAIPAAAAAGGAYYYSTLTRAVAAPVFKGDNEWVNLTLTNIKPVSHDSAIYTFAFPESNQPSGLIVASALLTKYVTPKGNNVIRPYTPISDVEELGKLNLLVKTYPNGKMSKHIANLSVNDTLAFKGPILKWKWTPNQFNHVGLIGGGSGITPLYQIVHESLKNDKDNTKITLLYGSKSEQDILLKPELDELAAKHPERFTVKYFVDELKDPKTTGLTKGFITKDFIKESLPGPSPESHVFVCGPPPLYKAISGNKVSPTDQGEVTGVLAELGYDKNTVFKF